MYFYRFIIFSLTLQQVLLVIELNEVRNFCQQMSDFSITFVFENINILCQERQSIRPSSSTLTIYFSQGNFTNWKHSITIFGRYLRLIWKIFVKKQKRPTHLPFAYIKCSNVLLSRHWNEWSIKIQWNHSTEDTIGTSK